MRIGAVEVVHHFDLARFFFGELDDLHVVRARGTEHTVVVTAFSSSGAAVSIRANTTGATLGFATELEHFRRVVTEAQPCESDIASAAASLELTTRITEQVLQAA
jgi:hypothetical protein